MSLILTQDKIFPERLPRNFHGPLKPFARQRQFNEPVSEDRQLQKQSVRLNSWKRRKSDREIELTNRVLVSNPVRTSSENPEWLKSTFFYQQRALQHRRERDHKHYDILGSEKGQERKDFRRTIFPVFDKEPLKFDWPAPDNERKFAVTSKVGFFPSTFSQSERRVSHSHYEQGRDVTPKIGSVESRDFSMRKTVVKIGHNTLIDTHSVL